jgi:hypothetical protein
MPRRNGSVLDFDTTLKSQQIGGGRRKKMEYIRAGSDGRQICALGSSDVRVSGCYQGLVVVGNSKGPGF